MGYFGDQQKDEILYHIQEWIDANPQLSKREIIEYVLEVVGVAVGQKIDE